MFGKAIRLNGIRVFSMFAVSTSTPAPILTIAIAI